MTDAPRILFLAAEPPHTAAAGAIVFHRLFRDYPADRLLVVSNHRPPAGAATLPCRYEHLPLLADRLNSTRFWPWKAPLRALGASRAVRLARVDRTLRGFSPEVVVTLMQNPWFYDLAARFAAARRLPLVLAVHDLPDGFEPVPAWLAPRQRALDRAVYRQAAARLCISQPMADHFSREFGISGEVLLPPRSERAPSQPPEHCAELKAPHGFTLGYAGGLHYGYGEQLRVMLPALRETGTRLELFGPPPAGAVASLREATDILHFNGEAATPEEAARTLLAKCDAVLLPYLDPPGAHERQYRTHFPSKLGDCLSLGLPLLATGPTWASGVQWCREHQDSALHVSGGDRSALTQALLRLRTDSFLRIRLARRAQSAAAAFDTARLREQFRAVVERARAEPRTTG